MYIENMQDSFEKLDGVLNEINGMAEAEEVDPYQVKAIFYALFFGKEYPRMDEGDYRAFADCFVEYEEREDEEGETYTVAIPIQSLNMVYGNLAAELNQEVSLEDKTNVQRIYMLAKYGVSVPGGNGLPPGQAMGDGRSGVYHLSRTTAQGIYDQCAIVSREEARPGDLVFFTGTYASAGAVSHVGIYVGGSRMLHCGSPIGYADLTSPYWNSHLYAFGRLATIPE